MNTSTKQPTAKIPNDAPPLLKEQKAWLCFKLEQSNGEKKPRKVPYYANGNRRHGTNGSIEDRKNLSSFEEARDAAISKGFDGIGFAFLSDVNILAIDIDNCKRHGKLHPDVAALCDTSYAEYSPSGNGVHIFFRGDLGDQKAATTVDIYGFESFSSKGYVTFTGDQGDLASLARDPLEIVHVPESVKAIAAHRFGKANSESTQSDPLMDYNPPIGFTLAQSSDVLEWLFDNDDYNKWLQVGAALHHEHSGSDEALDLWDEWSQSSSTYQGYGILEYKWQSFGKTNGKTVSMRTLIKEAQKSGYTFAPPKTLSIADVVSNPLHKPSAKFAVIPSNEFTNRPHPTWIIDDVIPQAELVVLYGSSTAGKSFVALDMAAAVVRGVDWRGKEVKQGNVIYIAAEGKGGFPKRIKAYEMTNSCTLGAAFGVIEDVPNFLEQDDAVAIIDAVTSYGNAHGKIDIVIVDTFAQVTPGGNENSGEDMGKAINHCKAIHGATGALVVLIHHAGKDASKGSRGWSGLRAAADAEIEVSRSKAGRTIKITKQKDGDDEAEWGFELGIVEVDTVGLKKITSCVVIEAEIPEEDETPVSKVSRVLELFRSLQEMQGNGRVTLDDLAQSAADKHLWAKKSNAKKGIMALTLGNDVVFNLSANEFLTCTL